MMRNLLNRIAASTGCRVLLEAGFPAIESSHQLPDDLNAFYGLCGGVELFVEAPFSTRISSPSDLVLANRVMTSPIPGT